uniref:Ig-like domain-containing protein n=1 Tax=Haplochromis burtoni TaxID=8153 RepID=A0A3Q2VKF3_HAPBU
IFRYIFYKCHHLLEAAPNQSGRIIVSSQLLHLHAKKLIVEEGSAAVLPCALSSKQDITNVLFDWKKGHQEVFMYDAGVHYNNGRPGQDGQFKGRVSHLEEELKHGNASIRINNTRVSDSGNYTCLFPRLNPPRTFSVQLIVNQISVHGWSVVLGILIGAVGTLLMIGAIGTCQRGTFKKK